MMTDLQIGRLSSLAIKAVISALAFAILVVVFWVSGGWVAVDILFALVFGWVRFLARVAPRITLSRAGLATGVLCLSLFAIGLHSFLRWISREIGSGVDRWSPRWSLAIVSLIVVMFASGIAMVGITHQSAWLLTASRPMVFEKPTATLMPGHDNLMSIGLALHGYHSAYDTLPYEGGKLQLPSWQARIIPYTYEYDGGIDFSRPWDDPRNSPSSRGVVRSYLNHGVATIRDPRGYALSHYAGNVHIFGTGGPRTFDQVRGGLSQVMMAGEVASGFKAWADPTNLRDPTRPFDGSPEAFGAPSGGGATVLMMDGSIRFVSDRADPSVLRALSGRADR